MPDNAEKMQKKYSITVNTDGYVTERATSTVCKNLLKQSQRFYLWNHLDT